MHVKYKKLFLISLLSIYFCFGILIYDDYGIGIEEHFQRQNGFFWLKYLLNFTSFNDLISITNLKFNDILINDPSLPNINFFNFYGIIFDVPVALIEILLNLEKSKSYFLIRHIIIFLIFFMSSIFFYKILIKRFPYHISVFGFLLYILTPRIFGDSFHNNKDILFLSLLTIALSFLFKLFYKTNNKNLILFCIFSALATSTRVMGLFLPILFILFIFVEFLVNKKNIIFSLKLSAKTLFLFIFFLYLHYPYMWELNIFEFYSWFKKFFYSMDLQILFNDKYYPIQYLPRSYLSTWIFISTPIFITFLFLVGTVLMFKRLFKRILNIKKEEIINSDFWASSNEKKDFFILISFYSFLIYATLLNVAMLSGWRHFYFLHVFLIYISIYGFYNLCLFFRGKTLSKFINFIMFFLIIFLIRENIKFHPYQSLYFNTLISSDYIKKFQVDSPSLSRADALNQIIADNKKKKQIFVANASWTPFYNGADLLNEKFKDKFVFVGQEFRKADYIYDNFIYKSAINRNDIFTESKDFTILKKVVIDNVHIYSIYKKKK